MQISCWQEPPDKLSINNSTLHLWRFSLQIPDTTVQALKRTLGTEELARANRLLDPGQARDGIVARGRLRQILGNYLQLPAEQLTFSYGNNGKPALHPAHISALQFNLAHSGNLALLAISRDQPVGCDLEKIDPAVDYQKIAAQFFAAAEVDQLAAYPVWRQTRGFYRIWTAKEAGLKRVGSGFSALAGEIPIDSEVRNRHFPVGKSSLAAISISTWIETVQRYQLA